MYYLKPFYNGTLGDPRPDNSHMAFYPEFSYLTGGLCYEIEPSLINFSAFLFSYSFTDRPSMLVADGYPSVPGWRSPPLAFYWGSVDGFLLAAIKKEWLKEEYKKYYAQGDGEWFVTTCLCAGMELRYATALRTSVIRVLKNLPKNFTQEEWEEMWFAEAVHQTTVRILEGRIPKGIEIRYTGQTESNWWLPPFDKLVVEQADTAFEAKALEKERQKLKHSLETLSQPYLSVEIPFSLVLHRFWQSANASDPQSKRQCFALQGKLLPPPALLKTTGYSAKEKLRAKTGLNGKHPLFSQINRVVDELKALRKRLMQDTLQPSAVTDSLNKLVAAYQHYVAMYLSAETDEARQQLQAPHPVLMYAPFVGCRVLSDAAAAKLGPTMETETSEAERGTSKIKILQEVYFKENPHAPGVEFMVASLSSLIAGRTVTPTELLKVIQGDGLHRVYQASRSVQGKSLETIIKTHPEWLNKIA